MPMNHPLKYPARLPSVLCYVLCGSVSKLLGTTQSWHLWQCTSIRTTHLIHTSWPESSWWLFMIIHKKTLIINMMIIHYKTIILQKKTTFPSVFSRSLAQPLWSKTATAWDSEAVLVRNQWPNEPTDAGTRSRRADLRSGDQWLGRAMDFKCLKYVPSKCLPSLTPAVPGGSNIRYTYIYVYIHTYVYI